MVMVTVLVAIPAVGDPSIRGSVVTSRPPKVASAALAGADIKLAPAHSRRLVRRQNRLASEFRFGIGIGIGIVIFLSI